MCDVECAWRDTAPTMEGAYHVQYNVADVRVVTVAEVRVTGSGKLVVYIAGESTPVQASYIAAWAGPIQRPVKNMQQQGT